MNTNNLYVRKMENWRTEAYQRKEVKGTYETEGEKRRNDTHKTGSSDRRKLQQNNQ